MLHRQQGTSSLDVYAVISYTAASTSSSSLVFAGPLHFFAAGACGSTSSLPKTVIAGNRMRKWAEDVRSCHLAVGRSGWMHTTHTFSEPTVRLGHRGVRKVVAGGSATRLHKRTVGGSMVW